MLISNEFCIRIYRSKSSRSTKASWLKVRTVKNWKYALSLPLEDSGFDFSALSKFRKRLIEGGSEELLLNRILEQLREKELIKGHKRQRTDSTHILAAIRPLNRLETLGETMRAALNSLAAAAPDWLVKRLKKDWFDCYGRRVENYRLPKLDSERETLGSQMGEDGFNLLKKVYAPNAPEWLRLIPAVEILRIVWVQQFYAPVDGQVQWRSRRKVQHTPEFLKTYNQRAGIEGIRAIALLRRVNIFLEVSDRVLRR